MTPKLKSPGLKCMVGALAAALIIAGSGAVSAQTMRPPGSSDQPDQPSSNQPKPPPMRPAPPQSGPPDESLGQGVLHPPPTGDRNVIPPRNQTDTPTPNIRPPGTPGGNPNVVPR